MSEGESKQYMRKFVLTTPNWVTGEQMAARAQNHLTSEVLFHDSKDKKFLITIIAEEV